MRLGPLRPIVRGLLGWGLRRVRSVVGGLHAGLRGELTVQRLAANGSQVFFGYYDVTPFGVDGRRILAMHGPRNSRPLAASAPEISVGYYDLSRSEPPFVELGRTTTWCWQQGCRLQWYRQENGGQVLYNRLVDGACGAVVQDAGDGRLVRKLARPIYAANRDGAWGLSLDFSRLHRLRPGYGYANLPDKTAGELAPASEGIRLVDMKTGKDRLLFSVADIAGFEPLPSMAGAEHYFNHILFNPSGTRFMFFHLWLAGGRRFSRLITCDRDGGNRYALVNEGLVSHYCWKSDAELLATARHAEGGFGYYLYQDLSDSRRKLGEGALTGDGHPSYSPDGARVLTDTYPDKYGERNLLLYDPALNHAEVLGCFLSPWSLTGEIRCDLHPRWDRTGRRVCIDSAHEGRRAMYVIDLDDGGI